VSRRKGFSFCVLGAVLPGLQNILHAVEGTFSGPFCGHSGFTAASQLAFVRPGTYRFHASIRNGGHEASLLRSVNGCLGRKHQGCPSRKTSADGMPLKKPRIANYFRLEFQDFRERSVQSLQVSQYLAEEGCVFTDPKNISTVSEFTAEGCGGALAWKIRPGKSERVTPLTSSTSRLKSCTFVNAAISTDMIACPVLLGVLESTV
jgi:hypothetical protein